ncbi:hypothetical protein ERJ75_001543800 [Trypanosoma vivax]|nr:hypothetical protein ERJ75_001543800 [Trypanosoma vivax]
MAPRGGRVQRRSDRAGCADSRQGAHRQALPAYRGMRCRRHPAGADTWARRGHGMATAVDAGAGQQSRTALRPSRGGVCARGTDGCAQRGQTALAAMAEGPASGRYRDLEEKKGRRRDVDARSQERRRVWKAKKTNNASASRPPVTTIKARRAGRARGTGETKGTAASGVV